MLARGRAMNCLLYTSSNDEAGIFYAMPPEKDELLGAVGHVRIDFGQDGKEFWHTSVSYTHLYSVQIRPFVISALPAVPGRILHTSPSPPIL